MKTDSAKPTLENPYIVTTDDGCRFRCFVGQAGGGRHRLHDRLFFETTVRYVGPPWAAVAHLPDLQGVVAEWWEMKRALG